MKQKLTHITLFLIAAVFFFAAPQASAQTLGGTQIENTASLRYSLSNQPVDTVESNTVVLTVGSVSSMSLTKTASAPSVQSGGAVSFTIIVRNTGNVPLTSIQVRDTLDARFTGLTTDKGSVSNNILTWTIASLAPQTSDSVVITSGLVNAPVSTILANAAFASHADAPPASGNTSITVTASDSLKASITKTGKPSTLSRDTVRYTITATNTGQRTLRNVLVRDTLDAGMIYVGSSRTGQVSGQVIAWSLDTLAPGQQELITIDVRFTAPTAPKNMMNSASIFADSLAPVRAQTLTNVIPAKPAFVFRKVASSDTVFVGSQAGFVLRLRNTGNVKLFNLVVRDTIPTWALDQITVSAPATYSNGVVSALFDSIAPGVTAIVNVNGRVKPGMANGQQIMNRAYASSAFLPIPVSSTSSVVSLESPDAGLSFVKTASADSAWFGTLVTYTFIVTNNGSIPMTDVAVTDTLPTGMFDRSIILSPGINRSNDVVTATFGTLLPGQTDSLQFGLRLESDLISPTLVTNTAYATAAQLGSPIASSVPVIGYEFISMDVRKSASADTVQIGDTFFYTLTVANTGSKDLTNVTVTDTIPTAYLTPVSVIANGTLNGNIVTATFPDLFTEDSEEVTILVRARADQDGQPAIVNRVYAISTETGSTVFADSTIITTLGDGGGQQDAPALAFGKTVSKPRISVGGDVVYTLNLSNTGNVTLTNIAVIDTIPALITNPQVDANGTISGRIARWNIDSLRIGQASVLGITGRVSDTLTVRKTITNTAYASSDQTPSDTGRAAFTATIPTPDMSCVIHLKVVPQKVIGNGIESAVIEAFVSDTSGNPKPDGTPVLFKTPIGFFSNGLDSIIVETVNGYAVDSLRAIISSGSVVRFNAVVSVEDPGVCSASGTVEIVFFPGALEGIVLDNLTRQPVEGAVIIVYNSNGDLVATFTTGPDGTYLIPVPETDEYSVVILTVDRFGDPIEVTTTISVNVPGTGGNPPVPTKNLITGKIYFSVSGQPIVAQRLKVQLVSEFPTEAGSAASDDEYETIRVFGVVDSTITDSTGTYVFKDVIPGKYTVQINHPSIGGQMAVGSIIPGQMIVDANIPIVLNTQLGMTKTGPTDALTRDTVTYSIDIANTGTFSVDSVVVTDSLDAAMEFVSATAPAGIMFAYDPIERQVVWDIGRLDSTGGPRTSASLSVTVRFADSLSTHQQVTNYAFMSGKDITPSLTAQAQTNIVLPELRIEKTALKRVVEIGDITTYRIAVTNAMPTFPVTNVILEDMPPFGFSYATGSSYLDNTKLPDPAPRRMLAWLLTDTLQPGETVTLTYKLIVGAGALEGNGINTAEAMAITASGRTLRSASVEERVDVRAGLFADRGLIIGKVFYDENRNAYQDSGEVGVKGIEIMTSTGLRVITGDNGKYSIPDVEPGEHVLRVRERSLPAGGVLIEGLSDFAGDATSRFVQVTPSGIARADFYLFETTPDTLVMEKSIARVGAVQLTRWTDPMNLVFIEDERRAPMKLTGVSFETAKAELREEAATSLSELAEIMREYPDVSMLIVGHTDTLQIRTRQFPNNMVLSLARANAVKQFLFEREGIDSSRIRTLGLGELRPIAWNRTRAGRALNRRVEFYFNDDFEPKPLTVASILMEIAIDYQGSVPARSISFVDELDARFRYVPGSGLIDDSVSVEPTSHNGTIHWTIPNLGTDFSKILTYRVEIDKPDDEILTAWTTTKDISIETDSGVVVSDTTISTINHVAVAVRGRAANFVMSGILFRVGSASLRPAALSALDGAAEYLLSNPTTTLVVEGHTDATPIRGGQFRSNVDLSDARAQAVIDILHDMHGIETSRMKAFGFGALRPVASNETAEGRERNRRVELRIYKAEFSAKVIQAGRIDSSHATVARLMPTHSVDDGVQTDTVHAGEQYRLTLRVIRPLSSRTASLTIVDSLPSAMRLIDGSLEAVKGVSSVSGGRIIEATADPAAQEIVVTFVVEITDTMRRDEIINHEFYVVRRERAGDIIVDKHTFNGNGSRITAAK